MLIFLICCCHVPLHALDTLDTLTMSGIREKDHRFVFNTTTDGSVSARSPPAQTWKEISQRNALQIAGLSVASRPLGKIGEIRHLFQSQESANCMKPRQTMNIKSIVCLFAVVFIWLCASGGCCCYTNEFSSNNISVTDVTDDTSQFRRLDNNCCSSHLLRSFTFSLLHFCE